MALTQNSFVSSEDGAFAAAALPSGVAAGRTDGTFVVSASGSASYTIPIWTPPGVGATQLHLALTYDSRSPDGVMGVGWSLTGLGAITRCNRTWAQDGVSDGISLTSSDRLCLDGQQLKINGTAYSTEIESFSRTLASGSVGSGPASFTVTSKNGLRYDYGLTSDARIVAGTSGEIRAWALSRIRDRVGNMITITYTNDTTNGSYRVASIEYPTTATGQGPFYEVLFTYAARPATDIVSGYIAGFPVREPNKLTTITIQNFGAATPTKTYNLTYAQGTATRRLKLTQVQECSAANCLSPTNIVYQAGSVGWPVAGTALSQNSANAARVIPMDMNGDGFTDLVYPTASGSSYLWKIARGTSTGTFSAAASLGFTTLTDDPLIPADFAARGQTDLLYPAAGVWRRAFWNGTGFTTAATNANLTNPQGSSAAATAADVDGDGRPDLVWAVNPGVDLSSKLYLQRNTTPAGGAVAFAAPTLAFSLPGPDLQGNVWKFGANPVAYNRWSAAQNIQAADFDSDGRVDLIAQIFERSQSGSGCPTCKPDPAPPPPEPAGAAVAPAAGSTSFNWRWEVLHSEGTTFSAGNWVPSPPDTAVSPLLMDWNADGCTDFSFPRYLGDWTLWISNCHTNFVELIITSLPWTTTQVMALDYDTDGRTDLLANVSGNWSVFRSDGSTTTAPTAVNLSIPLGSKAWFAGDFNGDGLADLASSDQASSNALRVNLHNGAGLYPDLATSFTDGFGINQSPSYVSIARSNYTKHSDAVFPETDYKGPLYVVSQFTGSDGTGSTYQQQFSYYGARVHLHGRGFEGFYAKRMFDSRNSLYTYDYRNRTFPYTGMALQLSVYQSNGTSLIANVTHVMDHDISGGTGFEQRYFPFALSTTEDRYEFSGTLNGQLITHKVTTYTYADGFGNPTQVKVSVTDKDTTSPFVNTTWQTTVNSTFSNTPSANCFGLPTSTTVTNVVPGQTTRTRSFSSEVEVPFCRVTSKTIEPSTAALTVTTTFGFDGCGNIDSQSVVGHNADGTALPARLAQADFGTRCQFPESVTNPLSQSSTLIYDYTFGAPNQLKDPNGIAVNWEYDDFGRMAAETRADGTSTTFDYESCGAVSCASWGASSDLRFLVNEYELDSGGTNILARERFFDGLGHIRYDEHQRVFGTWTNNVVVYDSLGRVATRYRPYATAGNGYSVFAYDSLSRLNSIRLYQASGTLDRTTTIGYAGRKTSISDPLSHTTDHVADVLGRVRQVIDPAPGGTTLMDYDAFGNLNRIEDPIHAISNGSYNLRGFKTQWDDADRGTWLFTGNSLNELVAWTDAKDQDFSAIYDLLGRMTSRTEPEGISTWEWGVSNAANDIGRLKKVTGYGYTEDLTYDGVGRLSTRKITTDQAYQYDYAYNALGMLDTLTYPTSPVPSGTTGARFKIKYAFSFGMPYQISDVTSGTAATLWTLNSANDDESPLGETLNTSPSATTVTSGYKAWTGELTSLKAGVGASSTNRQNLSYQWDVAGNLTQRQDLIQSLTETFALDGLDRLLSTTGPSPLTMSYDDSGNVLSKSDVGSYTYADAEHPHGVTAAGTGQGAFTFAYDANGNVATRNGQTQAWASFNLPVTLRAVVSGSTYTSQFSYGPQHQRWKQVATYSNGTETTFYVGGLLEKMTATTTNVTKWRHYVQSPSGLTIIVSRNSDATGSRSHVLSDHLGSSDALLDQAGGFAVKESFSPFGARRGSNWAGTPSMPDWAAIAASTRRGFTFHEGLDNLGLTHMNGRVYDPAVGRFLSVDPLIANASDSQSFNPYAYVGNRPLSFTDPTGFAGEGSVCGAYAWACEIAIDLGLSKLFGGGHEKPPPKPITPSNSAQGPAQPCSAGNDSAACNGQAQQAVADKTVLDTCGSMDIETCTGIRPGSGTITADDVVRHSRAVENGLSRNLLAGVAVLPLARALPLARDPRVLGTAVVIGTFVYVATNSLTTRAIFGRPEMSNKEWIPPANPPDVSGASTPGDPNQLDPDGLGKGLPSVQFGANTNQTYHAFRHVDELGLDRATVEGAIRRDLAGRSITVGELYSGSVEVGGIRLQYNAYRLSEELINVGRITGP